MAHRVWASPLPVIAGVLLGVATSGCATNGIDGKSDPREKLAGGYLSSASAVHSELDMHMSLLLVANGRDCGDNDCDSTYHFEQRVQEIGERLSQATFAKYPELSKRFEKFEFVVADKYDAGAKSSGAGTIVILRGVERLGFDDASLAFIMAREMAHVVAGHYESNMLTSIAISIVVQLVMPVFNFARGAAAVASTSPAASTLAGSAASMAGNQALRANLRPGQLREAEEMGMEILVLSGYDAKEVVASLYDVVDIPGLLHAFPCFAAVGGNAQPVRNTIGVYFRGVCRADEGGVFRAEDGDETILEQPCFPGKHVFVQHVFPVFAAVGRAK